MRRYAVNDITTSALLSMKPKPVASSFPSGKENILDRISDSVGGGVSFVLGDVCPGLGYNGEGLRNCGVSLQAGAVVDLCREGYAFCLWPATDHGGDGLFLGGTT